MINSQADICHYCWFIGTNLGTKEACVVTTHGHLGALFRLKVHVLRALLVKLHRAAGPGTGWGDLTDGDGKVQDGKDT